MKLRAFIVIIYLIPFFAFSQTRKIDSLRRMIHSAKNDQEKLRSLLNFCDEYESLNPDTILANAAIAQKLAKSQNNKLLQLQSQYFVTLGTLRKGLPDSILKVCNDCLSQLSKIDSGESLWYRFSFLKVRTLMTAHKYQEAMNEDYKALKRAEQAKDTEMVIKSKLGVGHVHMELDQHTSAIGWFRNALQTTRNPAILEKFSTIYANLAAEYINTGKLDSAAYFIKEALRTARIRQDLSRLANALFIQSDLFIQQKKNIAAERNMLAAIEIRKQIGDPYYIVSDMADLASFYASTNQYKKGTALADEGIIIAVKTKVSSKLPLLYTALADNFKAAGDYRSYAETLNRLLSVKDSIYQKNSASALAELETKYQVQKKEATIAEQQLRLTKTEYFLWGSVIFAILSAAIIWLSFRDYRRKQKIKLEQIQEEEKRLSTQAVADAEESERKRIAADLHDNLGAQLSFIKRNVNYIIDQPHGFNQSDEKKYLGYVKDIAQNAMIDLRETIWVLNKDEVSVQEFADKLKSYLRQQLLDKDMIRWDFRENITQSWMLASGEVMHLFRIVQEIISNVIKHAESDRINIVYASTAPGSYQLVISDNGVGFMVDQEYGGHYGLENIQRRAGEINATLSVKSAPGDGTTITLTKGKNNPFELYNNDTATVSFTQ